MILLLITIKKYKYERIKSLTILGYKRNIKKMNINSIIKVKFLKSDETITGSNISDVISSLKRLNTKTLKLEQMKIKGKNVNEPLKSLYNSYFEYKTP